MLSKGANPNEREVNLELLFTIISSRRLSYTGFTGGGSVEPFLLNSLYRKHIYELTSAVVSQGECSDQIGYELHRLPSSGFRTLPFDQKLHHSIRNFASAFGT